MVLNMSGAELITRRFLTKKEELSRRCCVITPPRGTKAPKRVYCKQRGGFWGDEPNLLRDRSLFLILFSSFPSSHLFCVKMSKTIRAILSFALFLMFNVYVKAF